MENIEQITQIISNVGFPVAVVIWMMYERHIIFKELKEELAKVRQVLAFGLDDKNE